MKEPGVTSSIGRPSIPVICPGLALIFSTLNDVTFLSGPTLSSIRSPSFEIAFTVPEKPVKSRTSIPPPPKTTSEPAQSSSKIKTLPLPSPINTSSPLPPPRFSMSVKSPTTVASSNHDVGVGSTSEVSLFFNDGKVNAATPSSVIVSTSLDQFAVKPATKNPLSAFSKPARSSPSVAVLTSTVFNVNPSTARSNVDKSAACTSVTSKATLLACPRALIHAFPSDKSITTGPSAALYLTVSLPPLPSTSSLPP